MSFQKAIEEDKLWDGEMAGVVIAGRHILLVSLDGIRAFDDRCLHRSVLLSTGVLAEGVLTCAAHGWQYDPRTGQGINPCGIGLRSYDVKVEDGFVWVDVEEADDE